MKNVNKKISLIKSCWYHLKSNIYFVTNIKFISQVILVNFFFGNSQLIKNKIIQKKYFCSAFDDDLPSSKFL